MTSWENTYTRLDLHSSWQHTWHTHHTHTMQTFICQMDTSWLTWILVNFKWDRWAEAEWNYMVEFEIHWGDWRSHEAHTSKIWVTGRCWEFNIKSWAPWALAAESDGELVIGCVKPGEEQNFQNSISSMIIKFGSGEVVQPTVVNLK